MWDHMKPRTCLSASQSSLTLKISPVIFKDAKATYFTIYNVIATFKKKKKKFWSQIWILSQPQKYYEIQKQYNKEH